MTKKQRMPILDSSLHSAEGTSSTIPTLTREYTLAVKFKVRSRTEKEARM